MTSGSGISRPISTPARDRVSTLLISATELYVVARQHDAEEIRLYGELASQLYGAAPTGERARVAVLLAERTDAPRALVMTMIADAAEIARPLLLSSPLLDPADLLRLAQDAPERHKAILAERAALPTDVALALARTGLASVLERLAQNPTLPTDEDLFALIAISARQDPELARTAVRREMLAGALAARFLDVDSDGRRQIVAAAEARCVLASVVPGHRPSVLPEDEDLAGDLIDLMLAAEHTLYRARIARFLSLDVALVERMIAEASGEPHLILLKACGVTDRTIVTLILHAAHVASTSHGAFRDLIEWIPSFGRRAALAVIDELRPSLIARPTRDPITIDATGLVRPAARPAEDRSPALPDSVRLRG
jgi:uncharacterized protein (DUF2336 family)